MDEITDEIEKLKKEVILLRMQIRITLMDVKKVLEEIRDNTKPQTIDDDGRYCN